MSVFSYNCSSRTFALVCAPVVSVILPSKDFGANLGIQNISFAFIRTDDQIWTSLQVGNLDEKNTEKIQGGTTFEESISLLIYDLANDKVHINVLGILSYLTQMKLSRNMKK